MQRLSIPQELIDFHVEMKTSISTQFGPLTCMRLTGEPGTYDDNSDYNLAVIYSQYNLNGAAVMVSGDDSCIDGVHSETVGWPLVKDLLHLRFKTEITSYPLFCGYYVGCEGVVRSPLSLFTKLAIAVDDQSIDDKKLSYLTEFSVGHSLGQEMWNLIPVEQVCYQSAVFDFFCRHCSPQEKMLLKLGEVDQSILDRLSSTASWVSKPLYSMLSSAARWAILKARKTPSYVEDPQVTQLQGELLQSFQLAPNSTHFSGGFMDKVSDSQSTILSKPRLLPEAPGASAPSTIQPFQFEVLTVSDTAATASILIANNVLLNQFVGNYRLAKLLELELVMYTSSAAMNSPVTVSAIWVPANSTTVFSDILNTYGGQSLTLGGPMNLGLSHIVPADLTMLNPVIRDSVDYRDTPKLLISTATAATATSPLGRLVVRGKVHLSNPLLNPVASS